MAKFDYGMENSKNGFDKALEAAAAESTYFNKILYGTAGWGPGQAIPAYFTALKGSDAGAKGLSYKETNPDYTEYVVKAIFSF